MFSPRVGVFSRRMGTPITFNTPKRLNQPTQSQINEQTDGQTIPFSLQFPPPRPNVPHPPRRFFTTSTLARVRPVIHHTSPKLHQPPTISPRLSFTTSTVPSQTAPTNTTIHQNVPNRATSELNCTLNEQQSPCAPQHVSTHLTLFHSSRHCNRHSSAHNSISSVDGLNSGQNGQNLHSPISKSSRSFTTNHSPVRTRPPLSQRSYQSIRRNRDPFGSMSSLSSSLTSKGLPLSNHPLTTQRRKLFGVVQNMRHMDWDRVRRNKTEPFVWLEEYKLGRYRADQKRVLFHSRRTGGIRPPFDQRRGKYMEEYEYLHILEKEREERFWRMNLWNKANVVRRAAIAQVFLFVISCWNMIQDWTTRLLSRSAIMYRGWRWHRERRLLPNFLFLIIRTPLAILIRWVTSFFLRVEFTRNWTLRDLDWAMQNKVSGELYAKYRFPTKYSISKYIFAIWEPILNTFNHFHAIRLVWLNVFWPLMRRWWFHINDYKPYFGFMKFGALSVVLSVVAGMWTQVFTPFRYFQNASFAYKADFGHNYIALMTRAVLADVMIAMIEDGLIEISPLTQGHDFEINTKMKSAEFKFIDDEVERRCRENPAYREQLRLEGIPVDLDEFFGVTGIPLDATPKEQVLYILSQYNDYGAITRQMLAMMKPLYEFTDKQIRIMYSLGLCSERSWLNQLMGEISSPRIYLLAYRALLNIIGTRDGDTYDPSIQNGAMIRALTRKFDLTVLPPNPDHVYRMQETSRPYAIQFQQIPWDNWAQRWEIKQYSHAAKFHKDKPSQQVDLYHGADASSYDPEKHGDHQFFNTLPSVTNGASDVNLKGLGKAFFDPYVAVLMPAFHARPLDHEMVILQKIKTDLIQLARIAPEFLDQIPLEYDPYEYKNYISSYLRVYGVDKLVMWEKMMGRDFVLETPDLAPETYDVRTLKHAKWLWSQVLACVTEKIERHEFASPMYYIEDSCPPLMESPYRSKVDTVNRFQFRNFMGRPESEQQRRARDYQLIDPYAEGHYFLVKQYRPESRVYDFNNKERLDSRVERVHRTPSDDLGFWPGGKSNLPFLGVTKYPQTTPMLSNIGMLVTSAENLMTINRTAKDTMRQRTDWELMQPRYDPFGPQYRQNDGSYANTPEEDPRFRFVSGPDQMIPRGIGLGAEAQRVASGKVILPTQVSLRAARTFETELAAQLGRGQFRKDMDSLKHLADSPSGPPHGPHGPQTGSSPDSIHITNPYSEHNALAQFTTMHALHLNDSTTTTKTKSIVNPDGTKSTIVVNEPIVPISAHLKESEKEMLYRLQDNLSSTVRKSLHNLPVQSLSSAGLAQATAGKSNSNANLTSIGQYQHQPGQQPITGHFSSISNFHQTSRHQLKQILTDTDMAPGRNHQSLLDNLVSLSHQHPQNQSALPEADPTVVSALLRKSNPDSNGKRSSLYNQRTSSPDAAFSPQQQHISRHSLQSTIDPRLVPHDLAPLVKKYHAALDLHLSDPWKYPNPLPPRQPHDRKLVLEDTKDEYDMYNQIEHDATIH